jgi:cell wall-associated NlpC family hydrolase
MIDRRAVRPVLVLSAVVALLSPCVPAQADKRHPTRAELEAAQNRVTVARRSVATLQVRAEHAVEIYNGALSRAQKAARASDRAEGAARTAQARYLATQALATKAQADAETATAAAQAADSARLQAEAEAVAAQQTLDRIAGGAYRTDGPIGMVSQLLVASDPLELANGRRLMNQVADYQQRIISTLKVARDRAVSTSRTASRAQDQATRAADHAAQALAQAAAAKAEAAAANHVAAVAAQDAHLLLDAAHRAKAHAQALVTRADNALGKAVYSAKSLERAAAAARRAARRVSAGSIPSDAAGTAIRWAFEEIGVPYSWGGGDENGPTRGFAQGADTVGFDCSGLTLFIYAKAGIHLDHYTGSQWNQGSRISSRSDLKPGDLMFFAYDTSEPATIHHVSIYIGDGRMIEAPYTGSVVKVSSADRSDFIGATRPWD